MSLVLLFRSSQRKERKWTILVSRLYKSIPKPNHLNWYILFISLFNINTSTVIVQTFGLYVPLLTLAWQPLGAEVYVFSSTLRQQVFGICELVAWHDPEVVHQLVASKSFVVDKTAFTPQQSSLKKIEKINIYKDRNSTLQIVQFRMIQCHSTYFHEQKIPSIWYRIAVCCRIRFKMI